MSLYRSFLQFCYPLKRSEARVDSVACCFSYANHSVIMLTSFYLSWSPLTSLSYKGLVTFHRIVKMSIILTAVGVIMMVLSVICIAALYSKFQACCLPLNVNNYYEKTGSQRGCHQSPLNFCCQALLFYSLEP